MEDTQQDREDLRRAVRAHLAQRPGIAQCAATLQSRVRRECPCNVAQVTAAAKFLVALGHLAETPDSLGATPYYQATAAGILAHERGE
jgi:hypothetical protein